MDTQPTSLPLKWDLVASSPHPVSMIYEPIFYLRTENGGCSSMKFPGQQYLNPIGSGHHGIILPLHDLGWARHLGTLAFS